MRSVDGAGFAKDPHGRYVGFSNCLHFCWSSQLFGVAFWERPTEEAIRGLVSSLALELAHPPHFSLIDARGLRGVDPTAFATLQQYVEEQWEPLSERVLALAMIRPAGFEGAVVAGFFEVLPRPYELQIVDEPEEALLWLASRGLKAPVDKVTAELSEAILATRAVSPIVVALRAYLDANLVEGTLKGAASSLGASERSLQRRLGKAKTSFSDEQASARIRAAKRLLSETDWAVTRIALEVGFSSLQHLSAQFRKSEGMTPSAFRQQ